MSVPGELSAALVLSKCASARLDSVDPSEALSLPGVVAFVDHRCKTTRVIGQASIAFFPRDIPGVNNLTAPRKFPQEVFVTDKISHAGQVWKTQCV